MSEQPDDSTAPTVHRGSADESADVPAQYGGQNSPAHPEEAPDTLVPAMEPDEVVDASEQRSRFITDALVEGRDYGTVQGVPKPFLFKPGAERVTEAFGCYPRFQVLAREIDHDRKVQWEKQNGKSGTSRGLYWYEVSCDLVHRKSGVVVGNGLGACSTMEDKYVQHPRSNQNTALKMAKKRAHVDAALSTFGLSDMFTQDPDAVRNNQRGGGGDPSLSDECPFKKHKGEPWAQVVDEDPGYVEWVLDNIDDLDAGLRSLLEDALSEDEEGEKELSERGKAQHQFLQTIQDHATDADDIREVAQHFASWWSSLNDNVSADLSEWDADRFREAAEKLDEKGEPMLTQVRKWAWEQEEEDAEQGDLMDEGGDDE